MAKHYSDEDLRALLEYIGSDPAIPFPNLTKEERERLIEKVIEQYEEEKHKELNPDLVINLFKNSVEDLKASE